MGGGSGVYTQSTEYEEGYGVYSCAHPENTSKKYTYIRSRHMYVNDVAIPNRTSLQSIFDAIMQYTDVTQAQLDQVTSFEELDDLLDGIDFMCMTGACGGHCVCQCGQADNCIAPVYGCMDESAVNYMTYLDYEYVGYIDGQTPSSVGSGNAVGAGSEGSYNQYALIYTPYPYINTDFSDPGYEGFNIGSTNYMGECYYNPGCMNPDYLEYDASYDYDDFANEYNPGSYCVTLVVEGCTDPNALNYVEDANVDTDCTYQDDICSGYAADLLQSAANVNQSAIETICANFCQPVSGTGNDGDPYTFDWMTYGSSNTALAGQEENPLLYQFCTEGCCEFEYIPGEEESEENECDGVEFMGCETFNTWLGCIGTGENPITEEVFCNNCFDNIGMAGSYFDQYSGDPVWQYWGEFFNEECACCVGWEEFLIQQACGELPLNLITGYCESTFPDNVMSFYLNLYPDIELCCGPEVQGMGLPDPDPTADLSKKLSTPEDDIKKTKR
jgi:hypothetical protein